MMIIIITLKDSCLRGYHYYYITLKDMHNGGIIIITLKDTCLMGYYYIITITVTLKDTCLTGYYYYYPERHMPTGVSSLLP